MSYMNRDLVFMMLQFLNEENYLETMHKLEKESGVFFNSNYFLECITNGAWEEVESYLSGFTKLEDNQWSIKMFFEIRKQKYLEALDSRDDAKAVQILRKDLHVFSNFREEIYKDFISLIALPNFRMKEELSMYTDAKSARASLVNSLEELIRVNPLLCGKREFPSCSSTRLRLLATQSLQLDHCRRQNPNLTPDARRLFADHSREVSNSALMPPPAVTAPTSYIPALGGYQPTGARVLAPASVNASPGGWMTNSTQMPPQAVSGGLGGLALPHSSASMLNPAIHPPTNNPGPGFQNVDSGHVVTRPTPIRISKRKEMD